MAFTPNFRYGTEAGLDTALAGGWSMEELPPPGTGMVAGIARAIRPGFLSRSRFSTRKDAEVLVTAPGGGNCCCACARATLRNMFW
jgi:hypothetical protein